MTEPDTVEEVPHPTADPTLHERSHRLGDPIQSGGLLNTVGRAVNACHLGNHTSLFAPPKGIRNVPHPRTRRTQAAAFG